MSDERIRESRTIYDAFRELYPDPLPFFEDLEPAEQEAWAKLAKTRFDFHKKWCESCQNEIALVCDSCIAERIEEYQ